MKIKMLVLAKTYPTFSKKYTELVCTAGVLENGQWVRIYPIPFRSLSEYQQYKKYDWIELDVRKRTQDFRCETYEPCDLDSIKVVGHIPTDKFSWGARRDVILKKRPTEVCLDTLIDKTRKKELSLGLFKPSKIEKLIIQKITDEDMKKNLARMKLKEQNLAQGGLFEENKKKKPMPIIPYKFLYKFYDINGKSSSLQILDWEIFQLFINCQIKGRPDSEVLEMVKEKYEKIAHENDAYFFMGTRLEAEKKNQPNPYSIIGLFYPPHEISANLFD